MYIITSFVIIQLMTFFLLVYNLSLLFDHKSQEKPSYKDITYIVNYFQ